MSQPTYATPLDQLLTLGRPAPWDLWVGYASLGVRREHVGDLVRMATDAALLDAPGDDARAWAPLHAWRALGQLRAEEAIEPLISLLARIDAADDEAVGEDLPKVFGQIGLAALESLKAYAANARESEFARVAAVEGIKHIGMNPPHRDACAAAMAELLDRPDMTDETVNAFLVIGLCELHAKKHIEVIERAFGRTRIEEQMCGKLADVRAELGLAPPRATQRPANAQLAIDLALDMVLPPSAVEDEPQWIKDFLK
jgi:hypothetical protein